MALSAQQLKIAILDAQIPKNMDSAIVIPVTEKIIERFVASGRYIVLDRANIEQVFKEREFQLSDIVSDQDAVAAAGKYLGADFVVVVKIQQVGQTYFLTAKMIAITTGIISSQTSAEVEGKLSSLIGLAGKVGDVLASTKIAAPQPSGTKPGSQPAVRPTPPPSPSPAGAQISQGGSGQEPAVGGSTPSAFGAGWLSVGIKGSFTFVDTTMNRKLNLWTAPPSYGISPTFYDQSISHSNSYMTVLAWIDATYAELCLGYGRLLSNSYTSAGNWFLFWPTSLGSDPKPENSGSLVSDESFISIAGLAKYPFRFGSLSLSPLLGLEYDIYLSYNGKSSASTIWDTVATGTAIAEPGEAASQNRLFILGGIEVDYDISGPLFVRTQGLFGYKLQSPGDVERMAGWKVTNMATGSYSNKSIGAWKIDASVSFGCHL